MDFCQGVNLSTIPVTYEVNGAVPTLKLKSKSYK